jgi:hypothetical protein
MKLPRLDFTSYRDSKGYRLAGKVPPRRGRKNFLEILNMFSGYIEGNGGKPVRVDLNQWPRAFEEFAAAKTPGDLVRFITKYGPLTRKKRQNVFTQLDQAQTMRECMNGKRTLQSVSLSTLLYQDPTTGEAEVSVTPSSLIDALWLQYQHSQSSGAGLRKCPYCDTYFAVGGNSGRLRNAEFCSPEHRKRFNSLKRSNPALRAKRKRRVGQPSANLTKTSTGVG